MTYREQLQFRTVLKWNDKIVCNADTTAAMAYNLARNHIAENFVHNNPLDAMRTPLAAIQTLTLGQIVRDEHSDETGKASWYVERIS